MVRKHPYVIGYFVWTAMDNLGEAGRGMPQLIDIVTDSNQSAAGGTGFNRDVWPVFTNYQGDIDLIGNRKVASYYQSVVWGKSKVEMFVHRPVPAGKKEVTSSWGFPDELKSWNWKGHEGEKFQVHVYTRSQQVRLELNGRIVGEQNLEQGKSITATFDVQYEAGKLIARCYDNGKETASETIETTGKPIAVRLIADRTGIKADRNDLSYIRAEIIDSEGNIVPDADDIRVTFEVKGRGELAGVGSGNPKDMSGFKQANKKTYQGICLAIVRPETTPGRIHIRAGADSLKTASLTISVH
jgi:beta-galactosidase